MYTKLIKTVLFATSFILACGIDAAKTLDVRDAQKDMRVMSGILETTLKESKDDFPGRPVIKTTYLAQQGYLFTVRLNGLGSLGIPGVAGWESGRLELDIPEIIEEAFAAIDYDSVAPEVMEELGMAEASAARAQENAEENREYQEKMRRMREEQRQIRREISELSRQMRRSDDDDQVAQLEKDIDKLETKLKAEKKSYYASLDDYKKNKLSKQIGKTDKAVNAILNTFCDYGSTIRSLKKGEKLNLLIQGGLTADGQSKDQMFIFDQSNLRDCDSTAKLRKEALYYVL